MGQEQNAEPSSNLLIMVKIGNSTSLQNLSQFWLIEYYIIPFLLPTLILYNLCV